MIKTIQNTLSHTQVPHMSGFMGCGFFSLRVCRVKACHITKDLLFFLLII